MIVIESIKTTMVGWYLEYAGCATCVVGFTNALSMTNVASVTVPPRLAWCDEYVV